MILFTMRSKSKSENTDMAFLEPKEITVPTQAGDERTYIIGKFPAVPGLDLLVRLSSIAADRLSNPQPAIDMIPKLMAYVAVPRDGADPLPLTTAALVNNHVPDWETGLRLLKEVVTYNTSFFREGRGSDFFKKFALSSTLLNSATSMASSAQSSPKDAPPSPN